MEKRENPGIPLPTLAHYFSRGCSSSLSLASLIPTSFTFSILADNIYSVWLFNSSITYIKLVFSGLRKVPIFLVRI
jgi:hypothetical protein